MIDIDSLEKNFRIMIAAGLPLEINKHSVGESRGFTVWGLSGIYQMFFLTGDKWEDTTLASSDTVVSHIFGWLWKEAPLGKGNEGMDSAAFMQIFADEGIDAAVQYVVDSLRASEVSPLDSCVELLLQVAEQLDGVSEGLLKVSEEVSNLRRKKE